MATTRYAGTVVGPLLKTAKFDVTADNDVILSGDRFLIVGAIFDTVTALNIDGGEDILAYPVEVAADEQLQVTTTGAGSVTLLFAAMPTTPTVTYDN